MEKKTREQRLHEVAELIERSRTFAMDRYANHCGTPGCIAGHVVALERGAGRIRKYMLDDFSNQRIADMAQEILGLTMNRRMTFSGQIPRSRIGWQAKNMRRTSMQIGRRNSADILRELGELIGAGHEYRTSRSRTKHSSAPHLDAAGRAVLEGVGKHIGFPVHAAGRPRVLGGDVGT